MLKARVYESVRESVSAFVHDEQGGGVLWGLYWFTILVAVTGVSVDGTNGFRNQTMLQATADAAALAAAIDLPRSTRAIDSAVEYAEKNLPPERYGPVLLREDVELGKWDFDNRVFDPDAPDPDSVRVRLRSGADRGNSVLASFLRIIGFRGWEMEATAIAQRFIPQCYTDGLVARGYVDTSSNNEYYNDFCIHGQMGVMLQNGSYFELGTSVSMPDLEMLSMPTDGFDSNEGLREALREGSLDPRQVDHVPETMDLLLDPSSPIQPVYIDTTKPVIEVDCKFDMGTAEAGRIYHAVCPSNKQIKIPGGSTTREVVLISEAQIDIPSNAVLEDVILASRASKNNDGANIHFASSVKLGRDDDCANGGGVQIFTTENLSFSSSATYNGVQIVSAKNVALGSSDQGVKGLAVQAGGNITLSSNNRFGLCNGDDPLLLTNQHYRLVL